MVWNVTTKHKLIPVSTETLFLLGSVLQVNRTVTNSINSIHTQMPNTAYLTSSNTPRDLQNVRHSSTRDVKRRGTVVLNVL
jgi:hypothetical protein